MRAAHDPASDSVDELAPAYFLALWSAARNGYRPVHQRLYLGPYQTAVTARILRVTAMQWSIARAESEVKVIARLGTPPSDRYALVT